MPRFTNFLNLKLLLSVVAWLSTLPLLMAQTYEVSGTIKDVDNQPLPGVNLIVRGTTTGTNTDTQGGFSLNVPGGNQVIIVSYVGYETQEINVSGPQELSITLEEDLAALDEIVVLGYGTETKRNVSSSVSTVKGEELTRLRAPSLDVGLQGLATGIQVTQTSGAIGSPVRVMVRGINTISNVSEPLYVIDGIPLDPSSQAIRGTGRGGIAQNPLALINPNDIESVEILKDAAATAIYGNRGSNGVIIITTKRGKQGVARVTLNYSAGISTLTRDPEDIGYVNTEQYLALADQARLNSGLDPLEFNNIPNTGDETVNLERGQFADTDWFDQILDNGGFHDVNLSSSRGFDKGDYYLSLNYRHDDGVLKNNNADRLTARLNLNFEPLKNISTGVRFTFAYFNNNRVRESGGGTPGGNDQVGKGGFGETTRGALPVYPVFNPDGSFFNPSSGRNLIASVAEANQRDEISFYRLLGGTFLEYRLPFLEGLSVRTELSTDIIQNRNIYWASALIRPNNSAFAHENNSTSRNINYNVYGTFNRVFGDHGFTVVVGGEWQKFSSVGSNIIGEGLRGIYQEVGGTPSTVLNASAGLGGERNLAAQFARFNYVFKDRYLLGFSQRYDGSSVFRSANRWQPFFAASAGWILSDEAFMEDLGFISFLKLRGSYGESGNQFISPVATLTTFLDWPAYALTTNAFMLSNLANPGLLWETTASFEIGLDFGLLADRITGTFGYYQQTSTGILLNTPVPISAGLQFAGNNIWANFGDIRNQGFEISINSVNIDAGGFRWSSNLNFTTNQNEILNLSPELDQNQQGVTSGLTFSRAGGNIGAFYLAEHAGVDPELGVDRIYAIDQRREIDGAPNPDFNQRMQATDGSDSTLVAHRNNVNGNRRILEETGMPTFFGGLTNTLSYKGVELSFLLTFQGGNYIYDSEQQRGSFVGGGGNVLRTDLIGNTWAQPGDIAEYPQLVWNNRYAVDRNGELTESFNERYDRTNSTRFLHKGDFVRLRNIQLAYDFPTSVLDNLGISGLRVYVAANNLLTFTSYEGWDPEQYNFNGGSQNRNLQQGIADTQVPSLRTFLGGISLRF